MQADSKDNVFLVFGAAGGIGSALVQQLQQDGGRVALAVRQLEPALSPRATASRLSLEVDATDFEQVAGCVKSVVEWGGRLDGVVNCVGSLLLKPAHLTSRDDFEHVMTTNLTSAFAVVRAAAPVLSRTGGSIVLFSSAAGSIGLANHEAIAAAKAGVAGLVRSAAATYAAQGVRVNAIAPGLVQTPLTAKITGNEVSRAASTALHPLGRLGTPEDMAPVVTWLLSPASGWVTGQVIGIDGGLATLKTREVSATTTVSATRGSEN